MVARRLGRNKKACIRIVYRAAARKKIMTEAMLMVKISSYKHLAAFLLSPFKEETTETKEMTEASVSVCLILATSLF